MSPHDDTEDEAFHDRADAGVRLAARLRHFAGRRDVLVLALPRGGVPVGFEVARSLGVPLDVFGVRKLGVPGREELAMGAIASGGVRVLNEDIVRELSIPGGVHRRCRGPRRGGTGTPGDGVPRRATATGCSRSGRDPGGRRAGNRGDNARRGRGDPRTQPGADRGRGASRGQWTRAANLPMKPTKWCA